MKLLNDVLIAVVGGLATAVIVLILSKNWSHLIIPWFENLSYGGIRIDRKWKITAQGDSAGSVAEATINQYAHRIWGVIVWREGGKMNQDDLTGDFRDRLLTATYKPKSKNSLDRGTITLMCKQDGQLLQGRFAWYDVNSDKVISGKYELSPA